MTEQICEGCGHPQSDHDGMGACSSTIEQGKAFFECVCEDFQD